MYNFPHKGLAYSDSFFLEYIIYYFAIINGTVFNITVYNCWLQVYQNVICFYILNVEIIAATC